MLRAPFSRENFSNQVWSALLPKPRPGGPFLLLVLAGIVSTASAGAQASKQQSSPKKPEPTSELGKAATPRPTEAPPILQQLNSALQGVAAKVSSAVVQIQVTGYGAVPETNRSQTAYITRQRAVGSGVIVDSTGYVMTNAHVVEGAQRIRVVLPVVSADYPQITPEGKERVLDAKLIGVHKETDLALLKIEATDLPVLELGSARRVHQGQLTFAVGSPEGLQNSVTLGVVSSVGRQPDPAKPLVYIQTDAPINPGNSGGPLVDMDGYVLGINTFILSEGGGSEGLGFAIPARVVRFVYQSLRKYGHVHRVEVEAAAQTITPSMAEGLGLSRKWGVIIADVTPNGPADAAGMKVQDIVLSADDRPIDTLPAFTAALYLHPLDEVLKLSVMRGTEKKTLYIPVLEMKDQMDELSHLTTSQDNIVPRLGIVALDMTDQLRSAAGALRIASGVLVVARTADLTGPESGLQTGDVIHTVNRTSIDSLSTLNSTVRALKLGDPVAMQVDRGGQLLYLAFELD